MYSSANQFLNDCVKGLMNLQYSGIWDCVNVRLCAECTEIMSDFKNINLANV